MAWELNGNSDATATSFLGPTSSQPLIVKTTPSTAGATPLERLRVTSEGRVGVGVINPQAKLTVAGGGALINNVAIGTDGLSVNYPNEQETIGLANPGTGALLRLQSPNGLAFHTGAPGTAAADNLRMTITPSGEVGVGKAPGANYKLEVAGTVNATDYHKNGSALVSSQWADVSGGISYAGGNAGIGTADLQYGRLTIEDTGVPLSLRETGQAPTAGGLWRMPLDAGILRFDVNTAAAGDFSSYLTPLAMTAAGNVGIGTTVTVPGTSLDVYRDEGDDVGGLHLSTSGGRLLKIGVRADASNERAFIDYTRNDIGRPLILQMNGGNVGIGTMTPSFLLHIKAAGQDETGVGRARLVIENGLGHQWFANTWSRIDQFSIGRVGKRDDLVIDANGNVGISGNLNVTGIATKPSGGSWTSSSDIRLKKSVRSLKGALEKLLRLRGVSFEWKQPEKQGNLRGVQMGLVAQEVEEVFPEWISTDPRGYKNLTVRGFEALVVEAFKELKAENETWMTKNEELQDRIRILESNISEPEAFPHHGFAIRS